MSILTSLLKNIFKPKASTQKFLWCDEFKGNKLNTNYWNVETGYRYNNEIQKYMPGNIEVNNGLIITAKPQVINNEKVWTSGRINTKNKVSFKCGKVEACIKVPCIESQWGAFWMLGTANNGAYPQCGEIDIMEQINNDSYTRGALHSFNKVDGKVELAKNVTQFAKKVTPNEYHIYGFEWDEKEMRWYVDGECIHKIERGIIPNNSIFDQKFYIILNLAVGGWAKQPKDDTEYKMYVKWVKVNQ